MVYIHYENSRHILRQWLLNLHTGIQNASSALSLVLGFGNVHCGKMSVIHLWSYHCSWSTLRWKTYDIMNNRIVNVINVWFKSGLYITWLTNVPHECIYPAEEIRHKETPWLVLKRVLKLVMTAPIYHYSDVIMTAMASKITSLRIV